MLLASALARPGACLETSLKTLNRYLLQQVIASLVMTVAVFTFVLLLGNVLRELLPLLASRQATFGLLAEATGLLIPFVGAFALPIGMLTATLLVFGRFSADQELTAARASGLSLVSLITPIIFFSLLLCVVSAVVNMDIAPRCRVAYNRLRLNVKVAMLSRVQLPEGRPITYYPGYILFIDKVHQPNLQNVLLYRLKDETNVDLTVRAPRGMIEVDATNQTVTLRLFDATVISGNSVGVAREWPFQLDLGGVGSTSVKPGISDMTFRQLREELRNWERRIRLPQPADQLSGDELRKQKRELEKMRGEMMEDITIQMHRQVAFSFACFSFTLIGIPLGIRVHRRETNVGIAIALGLVAVYYSLIILASSQVKHPELAPHLWMWLPNLIFQAVGVVLLWRANRGM
jgi:lipopolysaccharide export system permease protein